MKGSDEGNGRLAAPAEPTDGRDGADGTVPTHLEQCFSSVGQSRAGGRIVDRLSSIL